MADDDGRQRRTADDDARQRRTAAAEVAADGSDGRL